MIDPMVSICCVTYNHEAYITQAIESFLMQKTSFPIEIIIHDDASTDNTPQIINEFEKKFPGIIYPILQKENQYSKGKRKHLDNFLFPKVRGKYIALCEGDDYWTDPLKLEKQITYLEKNPDCSICFHAAKHVNENNADRCFIHRVKIKNESSKFSIKDAILGGGGFMTTNSMVFSTTHIRNLPSYYYIAPVEDLPLMLTLSSKGTIGYLDQIMSVYRMATQGSWSSNMRSSKEIRRKHHKSIITMFMDFNKDTHYKYSFYVFVKLFKNEIKYLLND